MYLFNCSNLSIIFFSIFRIIKQTCKSVFELFKLFLDITLTELNIVIYFQVQEVSSPTLYSFIRTQSSIYYCLHQNFQLFSFV